MNISLKRAIAYLIDILLVTFVSSALTNLSFLNPKYDEYQKYSNKYITAMEDFYEDTPQLINIDINKDKKPDINIDTDTDNLANKNLINEDYDNDGKCDFNCDTNKDGFPDLNIDIDGDKKCDLKCSDSNDSPENDFCLLNCDLDNDDICDYNCDLDNDQKPDLNIDYDNDQEPDFNIDTNDDEKPDQNLINQDSNNDGICDLNCDINNDNIPELNLSFTSNSCEVNCEVDKYLIFNQKVNDLSYNLNKNGYVYIIGEIIIAFLYFSVFAYFTNGETLGKKIMKLKIVDVKNNANPKIYNYFLRTFILNGIITNISTLILINFSQSTYNKLLPWFTNVDTILIIIIFLMVMFSKNKRGLHDYVAHTKVIDLKEQTSNETEQG